MYLPFRRTCRIIILVVLLSLSFKPKRATAWYVTAPTSKTDWEQLARILADQRSPPASERNSFILLQWNMWGRRQAQDSLYRRYVRTARQMRGTKYAVIIAKEWGQVLGMAEMGIGSGKEQRRPTLGVLCVAPEARRQGVGAALVQRSEEIAANVWKEDTLWVEVETTNSSALDFFKACGYIDTEEKSMVAVQSAEKLEERAHFVLAKPLRALAKNAERQEKL